MIRCRYELRNKPCLSQDCQERGQVKCRTPEPDSTVQAGSLLQIAPEEDDAEGEEDDGVVKSICDPLPECRFGKENVLLAEYIELRISVKDAGGDELVKNTNDKWGEDCENNVVKGECP